MIKYIVTTNSNLIILDTETQNVVTQDNQSFNIDWLWVAEEDGMLNDQKVTAGDIILSMYPVNRNIDYTLREVFVIKDEKLKDYYRRLIEFHKEKNKLKPCEECEKGCYSDSICSHQ